MIFIPLTALIIMIGIVFIQREHCRHLEVLSQANKQAITTDEVVALKKRVDVLTLKNGFKL